MRDIDGLIADARLRAEGYARMYGDKPEEYFEWQLATALQSMKAEVERMKGTVDEWKGLADNYSGVLANAVAQMKKREAENETLRNEIGCLRAIDRCAEEQAEEPVPPTVDDLVYGRRGPLFIEMDQTQPASGPCLREIIRNFEATAHNFGVSLAQLRSLSHAQPIEKVK